MGDVSVTAVVPTFNRAVLLEQALDGLLGQSRPLDEILVVDDGSSDDTSDVVGRYGGAVDYFRQENAGKASALNAGLRRVSTGYVWIFDDDDWPLPDALEQLIGVAREGSGEEFVYSGCFTFTGPEVPAVFDESTYRPPAEPAGGSLFLRALQSFPFHQNGMLVPLRCYRVLGGYNEALARGQDYEMIIRLCRRYRGRRLDRPTFALREHEGGRGPQGIRHAARDRGRTWLAYDRVIFGAIRETVPLVEYMTPAERAAGQGTPDSWQAAGLRRASIMAHHGLLHEALADAAEALVARPLVTTVGQRLQGMAFLADRPAHDADSVRYLVQLSWIAGRAGWERGLKPVLRGAYWDLRARVSAEHVGLDLLWFGVAAPAMFFTGALSVLLRRRDARSVED